MSPSDPASKAPQAGPHRPLARWVEAPDRDWVAGRLGRALPAAAKEGQGVLLTGIDPEILEGLRATGLSPAAVAAEACLVMASRERVREWAEAHHGGAALGRVADACLRALAPLRPSSLQLPGGALELTGGPLIMGVVNVTPDSFSDGGRHEDPERAVAHALRLVEDGAGLLDIGGESTRPGAAPVSTQQELDRVLPVISKLRARVATPISIDTTKAAVAQAALEAGAQLVNDVSGFTFDPRIAAITASAGAAACLQHIQGTPESMQRDPRYRDVVAEVLEGLWSRLQDAEQAGVKAGALAVDPGIGFGKTLAHNLFLLRRLTDLRQLGRPILVGTSRKAFLGKLTGGRPTDGRLAATLGSILALAAQDAVDVVRVHDVAETRDALTVLRAIRSARHGGDAFAD